MSQFKKSSPLYKYEKEIKDLYLIHNNKTEVAKIIIDKYKVKIDKEAVRKIISRIVNNKVKSDNKADLDSSNKKVWDEKNDTASFEFNGVHKNINNLEEALVFSKVDLNIWEVERHVFNSWEVTMKDKNSDPIKSTNIQVKIWFKKKNVENNVNWNNFIEEIKKYSPDYSKQVKHKKIGKNCLYELSLPDLHVGKMAHHEETGENYDTKEATRRYNLAIDELLTRVNLDTVERFLLPIGNDMINIDNINNTTTAGTPQDCDSRWQQMFIKAKNLLITNIDKLSKIAPVHIITVVGNHDTSTMLYLSEVLSAWYRNSKNVTIDNNPKQRKYYEFGENMIAFTHGNAEKHQDLGLIVASEQKEMWARTSYREIHLGHFHKTKTTKYIETDEYQGFRVRILPSLSGTDAYHFQHGYMSTKAAEGFLYHKKQGLISTTRFNLK